MPSSYTIEPDEDVVAIIHRHWVNILPVIISTVVTLLLVMALSYAEGRYRDTITKYVSGSLVMSVMLVLVLLALLIFFLGMWVYRQNCLILTTKHLIQIEQNGLFGRRVAQLSLARVQDVSARRDGLLATIMNFGTVTVETAAEEEQFRFFQAPNPQGLANQLRTAHDQYAASPAGTAAE